MSEVLDPQAQAPTEPPSLRDALSSAFTSDTPAPEPPAATPEPPDTAARDDKGRFAPKAEGVQAAATIQTPDLPATPSLEAPQEPILPPASWSAQAKAKFAALDPEVQAEVIRREKDVSKGFEERASQLKKYEPLENVIAPHRERLALSGQDEATYVNALITADQMLQGPNKLQAFAQVAQMYGIDLRQFSQPGQPGPQPQQAQQDPQYAQLMQEIHALKQTMTEQQTAAQQASQSQQQAELDTFAKDHLYFENVRPAMAALIRAGQAEDLNGAYEAACWADPNIRPLMMAERATKEAEAARQAASAKVQAARGAGVSIAGSASPGSGPTSAGPPPSIGAALREAFAGGVQ